MPRISIDNGKYVIFNRFWILMLMPYAHMFLILKQIAQYQALLFTPYLCFES